MLAPTAPPVSNGASSLTISRVVGELKVLVLDVPALLLRIARTGARLVGLEKYLIPVDNSLPVSYLGEWGCFRLSGGKERVKLVG